jgi:hypothetical protein
VPDNCSCPWHIIAEWPDKRFSAVQTSRLTASCHFFNWQSIGSLASHVNFTSLVLLTRTHKIATRHLADNLGGMFMGSPLHHHGQMLRPQFGCVFLSLSPCGNGTHHMIIIIFSLRGNVATLPIPIFLHFHSMPYNWIWDPFYLSAFSSWTESISALFMYDLWS